jgi:hypothetical protein
MFEWIDNELKLKGFGQKTYGDGNMDEGIFKNGKIFKGFLSSKWKVVDIHENVFLFFHKDNKVATMFHGLRKAVYRDKLNGIVVTMEV